MPKEISGWECDSCEALTEEAEKDTLYECPSCGNRFPKSENDSHRCPLCNKFSTKVSDYTCQSCLTGEPVEIDLWQCDFCGDLFKEEEECQQHEKSCPKSSTTS